MIVLNPDNLTHNISFIPRSLPVGDVDLVIYNESTRSEILNEARGWSSSSNIITIDIVPLTLTEGDRLSYKVSEGGVVLYRGKIFATSQTTQNYKINE